MPYLLDTTALIDAYRQRPAGQRILKLLRAGELVYTSAVNIEEVACGIRPNEIALHEQTIQSIHVVPIGERDAWQAGTWRREFREHGITLSQADCLVASCAKSVEATLVTGNPQHFPMDGIALEHWPVGE